MNIVIGSDHAGFPLKAPIVRHLVSLGHQVHDIGSYDEEPVDFPDIAAKLCAEVLAGNAHRGIMVCGTGVGASIAANKTPGVRAAVCHDVYSARQSVEHDDVNVLCLGAQIIGELLSYELIDAFLNAEHSTAPEFRRRVAKLAEIERRAVMPTEAS